MGELVINVISGLFELIGTTIVEVFKESARKRGRSEVEIKKLEKNVGWSLATACIIFLFWLTFKYS